MGKTVQLFHDMVDVVTKGGNQLLVIQLFNWKQASIHTRLLLKQLVHKRILSGSKWSVFDEEQL